MLTIKLAVCLLQLIIGIMQISMFIRGDMFATIGLGMLCVAIGIFQIAVLRNDR